jgi:hypothetical protein
MIRGERDIEKRANLPIPGGGPIPGGVPLCPGNEPNPGGRPYGDAVRLNCQYSCASKLSHSRKVYSPP